MNIGMITRKTGNSLLQICLNVTNTRIIRILRKTLEMRFPPPYWQALDGETLVDLQLKYAKKGEILNLALYELVSQITEYILALCSPLPSQIENRPDTCQCHKQYHAPQVNGGNRG